MKQWKQISFNENSELNFRGTQRHTSIRGLDTKNLVWTAISRWQEPPSNKSSNWKILIHHLLGISCKWNNLVWFIAILKTISLGCFPLTTLLVTISSMSSVSLQILLWTPHCYCCWYYSFNMATLMSHLPRRTLWYFFSIIVFTGSSSFRVIK